MLIHYYFWNLNNKKTWVWVLKLYHTHTHPKMNNMHKSERIRLSIDIAISSSKDWIFSHQKAISMKKSEIKCTMMEECLQLKALKSESFETCLESERVGEEEGEDWKRFKVRAFPWDSCLSSWGLDETTMREMNHTRYAEAYSHFFGFVFLNRDTSVLSIREFAGLNVGYNGLFEIAL